MANPCITVLLCWAAFSGQAALFRGKPEERNLALAEELRGDPRGRLPRKYNRQASCSAFEWAITYCKQEAFWAALEPSAALTELLDSPAPPHGLLHMVCALGNSHALAWLLKHYPRLGLGSEELPGELLLKAAHTTVFAKGVGACMAVLLSQKGKGYKAYQVTEADLIAAAEHGRLPVFECFLVHYQGERPLAQIADDQGRSLGQLAAQDPLYGLPKLACLREHGQARQLPETKTPSQPTCPAQPRTPQKIVPLERLAPPGQRWPWGGLLLLFLVPLVKAADLPEEEQGPNNKPDGPPPEEPLHQAA